MRRLIAIFVFLIPVIGFSQTLKQILAIPNNHTQFGTIYGATQVVILCDSTPRKMYQFSHANTSTTDSMTTMYRRGWVVPVGSAGGGGGVYQWGINGLKIYYNTGNVGIGVTNPSQKFDIQGNLRVKDTIWLDTYGSHSPIWSLDGNGGIYFRDGIMTNKLLLGGTMSTGYDSIYVKDNATGEVKTAVKVAGGGRDSTITAGPISSLPALAYSPGTGITAAKWIQSVYYQTQAPTASLTGGSSAELHNAGTYSATLNWSGCRQSATATISTIVVDGVSQSFGQPAQGACASGTKSVTVTYNSTNTFTNTVTTTDSKTASASTSFTFYAKNYWGRCSTTSPNSATIIAVAGGSGVAAASRAQASFSVTASGSNYIYFAYPSSYGSLTSLTIGGFESLASFTPITVSVTNASSYVQNYTVYVSNNTFSGDATNIVTQ